MMHGHRKSDSSIEPAKPPNKAEPEAKEAVEERGLAEGNLLERNMFRTQSRQGMPARLSGYVRQQGGISDSGSRRSCTTFMTLSDCVQLTSRSGARLLQELTVRRGGTTERTCKEILKIFPIGSSEERIGPGLCAERT